MIKKLLLLVGLGWSAGLGARPALAQTAPPPVPAASPTPAASVGTEDWQAIFFDQPGVALPLLTAAAVRNSPTLKALETEKKISEQDIQLAKEGLLGALGAGGSYQYGNLTGIAVEPGNSGNLNTDNSARYTVGVSLNLPLTMLTSRGNIIKKERLTYERQEYVRQQSERALREEVISRYQGVRLAKAMLTLQQETFVSAQTTYRISEKEFRQGQLPILAFSQVSEQLASMAQAQETARNRYDTAFMLLEEMLGERVPMILAKR